MDFLPALFLVLVILLGGAIAVIADNLGRKFGKKRHTLFGLRPKHTATLMTTLAGIGVSAFTVGFVFVASKDVRIWIREGARAVRTRDLALADARRATESLAVTRGELEQAQGLVRESRTETGRLQSEVRERNRKVGELDRQLVARRADIARLTPLLARLRGDVGRLERQVKDDRSRIDDLGSRLDQSREALRRNAKELTGRRKELASLEGSLRAVKANRTVAIEQNRQAQEENGRLSFELGKLEREIAGSRKTIDELGRQAKDLEEARRLSAEALSEAQKKLETTQVELNRQELALVRATNDLRQALTFSQTLTTTFGRVRQNPITYRIGEEVARIEVPAGLSLGAARGRVDGLLRQARVAAASRGAKGGGPYQAADLLDRIDAEGRVVQTSADLREEIARGLADRSAPAVLSATSLLNAFASEPVSLSLASLPNPVVYRDGEVVAETVLSPRRSVAEILADVERFVAGEVRARAERKGMRPIEGSIGVVPPERIVDLVAAVRARESSPRVEAIADGDTGAASPLRLRFRIR